MEHPSVLHGTYRRANGSFKVGIRAPGSEPPQVRVCWQEDNQRHPRWCVGCGEASWQLRWSIFHHRDILCWPQVHGADRGGERDEERPPRDDHPPRQQHHRPLVPLQGCQPLLSLHQLSATLEGRWSLSLFSKLGPTEIDSQQTVPFGKL